MWTSLLDVICGSMLVPIDANKFRLMFVIYNVPTETLTYVTYVWVLFCARLVHQEEVIVRWSHRSTILGSIEIVRLVISPNTIGTYKVQIDHFKTTKQECLSVECQPPAYRRQWTSLNMSGGGLSRDEGGVEVKNKLETKVPRILE